MYRTVKSSLRQHVSTAQICIPLDAVIKEGAASFSSAPAVALDMNTRVAGILRVLGAQERSLPKVPTESSTSNLVVSFRLCNGLKSGVCNGSQDESGAGSDFEADISFIGEEVDSGLGDSHLIPEKVSEMPYFVIGNAFVSYTSENSSFNVHILTYGEDDILVKHVEILRAQSGGRSVSAISLDESKILDRSQKNTIHLHSSRRRQSYFRNVALLIAKRIVAANKNVELSFAWSKLLSIPALTSTKFSAYSAPPFAAFFIDLLIERGRSQRLAFMDVLSSRMFKILSNNQFSRLFSTIQTSFGGKCIFCCFGTSWKIFVPGNCNGTDEEPFFAIVLSLSQIPRDSYVMLLDSLPIDSEPDDYFEQHAKIQEHLLEKISEIMLSSLLLSID